jgi:hypothetical protein
MNPKFGRLPKIVFYIYANQKSGVFCMPHYLRKTRLGMAMATPSGAAYGQAQARSMASDPNEGTCAYDFRSEASNGRGCQEELRFPAMDNLTLEVALTLEDHLKRAYELSWPAGGPKPRFPTLQSSMEPEPLRLCLRARCRTHTVSHV